METSLNSDHLPIVIAMSQCSERILSEKKTYVNFKKADWEGFREFCDERFSDIEPPEDVHKAEKILRRIFLKAKDRFIPSGRIPKIRHNFPSSATILADERDSLRETNPADPRLNDLNKDINKLLNTHRKEQWTSHLGKATFSNGLLWKTIKGLTKPQKRVENTIIAFGDAHHSNPLKCANSFNAQSTEKTKPANPESANQR